MRYPNQRYGNPAMLNFYMAGRPITEIARLLKRDERSIRDWLKGNKKMPFWVPELLRLYQMEHAHQMQYMTGLPADARLGVARGAVLEFPDVLGIRIKNKQNISQADQAKANVKKHNDLILMQVTK